MTTPRPNPGRLLILLLAVSSSTGAVAQELPLHPDDTPRRVVLFVGDGVGVAHWSAALYATDGRAIQRLPTVGLVDPRNTSRPRPESASAATALATGVRTYYRAVGVGPDSLPRKTVLEVAEEAGLATGLATTALIADATPAASPRTSATVTTGSRSRARWPARGSRSCSATTAPRSTPPRGRTRWT